MQALTWGDVWQRRLARHFLDEPASSAQLPEVVRRLCGVHAQVMPSAELSLAVRVADLKQPELRAALWEHRSLVRT